MPAVKPTVQPGRPPIPHRNLPLLLLQGRESVIGLFRPILKAHGLTEQQWRVLRVLAEFGSLEPRQIGRLCGLSSPSLAGILARMDEQGLVTRAGLAHDKRRQAVTATPVSLALAAQMAPEIEAAYQAMEQRLGQAFVTQLYASLDELVAVLEVQAAGKSGEGGASG
jgi:homoprotocatechuate degradation regulator HpaR